MVQPAVGTRVFVPGGGRDRSCCKPLEPPPVSWGAFTVVAGPVARLIHVGDAVHSLSLSVARDALLNRRRALRQTYSSTQHPRKLPELTVPSLPPTPSNLVAQLQYIYIFFFPRFLQCRHKRKKSFRPLSSREFNFQ